MAQAKGFEPLPDALEASVLPLHQACKSFTSSVISLKYHSCGVSLSGISAGDAVLFRWFYCILLGLIVNHSLVPETAAAELQLIAKSLRHYTD